MQNLNLQAKLKKLLNPKNILISFFILFLILITAFIGFLYQNVSIVKDQTYEILPGTNSREIAYDLAQKEIIKHPWIFNLYVRLKNLDTKLQAGRYEFPQKKMSLKSLIEFLSSGARAKEIEFTVPEGWTVEQIAELLEEKGLVKKKEFWQIIEQEFSIFNFQFSNNDQFSIFNLEGYLFPDTYRVYEDDGTKEIIKKMLDNFKKKVGPELRQKIKDQGRTLRDVIIMASILEKEVKTEKDMSLVADILWRRLDAGKPLEVDSILNYILDNKKTALTNQDLQIDSPYNTYKYKGLPPTPISNPGLKAIKAAIYPESNSYWFYLSKPDGETVFSVDFEKHLENKARYLK